MRDITAKVDRGERLSEKDALFLFEGADLLELGELADRVNVAKNGNRVFFNVNRHINPTNICLSRCAFCAFSKSEGEEGAYEMSADEVLSRAKKAAADGATEIHIVGGLHPTMTLDWYCDTLTAVKRECPSLKIKGFTAVEIEHFAKTANSAKTGQTGGITIEATLERLIDSGLDSMPGGGAEILEEATRKRICPEKISGTRWLEIMEIAHRLGLRSNATMLYGHVESMYDRVVHMARLRELQDRTGGFMAFIPLAFQPKHSELSEQASGSPTTGFDDLKTIAVARLFLDNFDHMKSYWVMLGEKISQVSLNFGADDLDGTVEEEKIAHDAGAATKERMTRTELIGLIHEAGKTAVERDSVYTALKEYPRG